MARNQDNDKSKTYSVPVPTYEPVASPTRRKGRANTFSQFLRVGQGQNRARLNTVSASGASLPPSTKSNKLKYTFPELVYQLLEQDAKKLQDAVEDPGGSHIPHLQIEGRRVWEQFESQSVELSKHLQQFQDAVHELGSSLDLVRTAKDIQNYLSLMQWIFKENGSKLFPKTISSSLPPKVPQLEAEIITTQRPRRRSWPPRSASDSHSEPQVEASPIHEVFKVMAERIGDFRDALVNFPEFDNFGKFTLIGFESDLKYWSSCLQRHEGYLDTAEVQMYIHNLSKEMGEQFDDITCCLKDYIASAPSARLSQKHAMSNLQNLATVSTFFSAVTATTIQYSFQDNGASVSEAVNALWFISLVFSIASALNSFLVLTWRRATYSSPQSRIPRWLRFWIRQCAPIFLLISVVTFLVGLSCFTFSSKQSHLTRTLVIVCEAVSAFGLAALLIWVAADKWSYYRLQRQHSDPIFGIYQKSKSVLPIHLEHTASRGALYISRTFEALHSVATRFTKNSSSENGSDDVSFGLFRPPQTPIHDHSSLSEARRRTNSLPLPQQRWKKIIRRVIVAQRALRVERMREISDSSRTTERVPYLKQIKVWKEPSRQDAPLHTSTSDMQFSPRGDQIAFCGKRLNQICNIDTTVKQQFRLPVGIARQVTWSASGQHVLTRTNKAIYVHSLAENIPRQTIFRHESPSFILAIPEAQVSKVKPPAQDENAGEVVNSDAPSKFISVEGKNSNRLALLDTNGQEHWNHHFEDISIYNADVEPNGSWLLLVAINPQAEDGTKPMKASKTRSLIVFNLATREIVHEVPLWHEVQHATLSRNGRFAIITYNGHLPPQLWRLQNTPSGVRLSLDRQFCARQHISALEYDPAHRTEFSGKGQFLDDDMFVICATTDGNIHFWRRDKSEPIHILAASNPDRGKPVQIDCNPLGNGFMFSTRGHNGQVCVWKVPGFTPNLERRDLGPGLRIDMSKIHEHSTDDGSRVFSESPMTAQGSEMPS